MYAYLYKDMHTAHHRAAQLHASTGRMGNKIADACTHVTRIIPKRSNATEITIIYLIHNKILNGCFYHFNVCLHFIDVVDINIRASPFKWDRVELLNLLFMYSVIVVHGELSMQITSDAKLTEYSFFFSVFDIIYSLSRLSDFLNEMLTLGTQSTNCGAITVVVSKKQLNENFKKLNAAIWRNMRIAPWWEHNTIK